MTSTYKTAMIIICIIINLIATQGRIPAAKYEEAIKKCTNEAEADSKEINRIRKELILFNNDNVKRFLKCFYIEMDFLEDHNINITKIADELQSRYTNKKSKEIVNVCNQNVVKLQDVIEYVYLFTECLFNEIKKPEKYVKNLKLLMTYL